MRGICYGRGERCVFEGFPEETIRFFIDLRMHNETSFFHAHRDEYMSAVREPFYAFIEALAPTARRIAEDIETRPDKCLARIHRDTRFSNDKSPYRDHLWLLLRRAGEPRDKCVMYWFELGPDRLNWGLGIWGQNKPVLDELRRRMTKSPHEVLGALEKSRIPDGKLLLEGESYLRMKPPDGMPAKLAALYPLKSFYIERASPPFRLCYTKELINEVCGDFLRLKPMYKLLRSAADVGYARLDG